MNGGLVTIGARPREETACARGVAEPTDRGVLADPELIARGWQRRYLADEARASEARELYASLGFEVREERLDASCFGSECDECGSAICSSYVLIYTRKGNPRS